MTSDMVSQQHRYTFSRFVPFLLMTTLVPKPSSLGSIAATSTSGLQSLRLASWWALKVLLMNRQSASNDLISTFDLNLYKFKYL